MITVNTTTTILDDSVYVAECPHCDEQFLIYLYPKYICPHCCAFIPAVFGIINATALKLRYYFNENSEGKI